MQYASANFARVRASIFKEHLAVTAWLVVYERTLEDSSVTHEQLPETRPHVHLPVAFVVLFSWVAPTILDLSVTVLLTSDEVSHILCPVVVSARALPHTLSILEHACILAAVSHQEDTLPIFLSVLKRALILEEGVLVGVAALAVAQLRHRVDLAHVTILSHLVLQLAINHRDWLLSLFHGLGSLLAATDVGLWHGKGVSSSHLGGNSHRVIVRQRELTVFEELLVTKLHRHG